MSDLHLGSPYVGAGWEADGAAGEAVSNLRYSKLSIKLYFTHYRWSARLFALPRSGNNHPRLDVHYWWNVGAVALLLPATHTSIRRARARQGSTRGGPSSTNVCT